jgi:hypothetical protein
MMRLVISRYANALESPRTFVVLGVLPCKSSHPRPTRGQDPAFTPIAVRAQPAGWLRGKSFRSIEPAGLFRDHAGMPSWHPPDRRFQKLGFTVKLQQF